MTFSTSISIYCRDETHYIDINSVPWCKIFYLAINSVPWCDIFYHDINSLPWCNIFYLDINLLPWCNIFYLDINSVPWWNIFYLDINSLPSPNINVCRFIFSDGFPSLDDENNLSICCLTRNIKAYFLKKSLFVLKEKVTFWASWTVRMTFKKIVVVIFIAVIIFFQRRKMFF